MSNKEPIVTTLAAAESFSPPHHEGTTSVELANPQLGSERAVFRVSTMEPGARDEWHAHAESDQLMFVRRGTAVLRLDEKGTENEEEATRYRLSPDSFAYVPRNTHHRVTVTGSESYEVILVWVPPYQSMDEWSRDSATTSE
ncbi:cupin domain-containing protein [Salinigranum marinum]|uniref:cupin domain-containing protein n=1 Tax=Salinigranum marinum TaxID=1515595 RepID=UPI002989AEE9|nr:cupin domain-containing protein [Salinigranum marinum]